MLLIIIQMNKSIYIPVLVVFGVLCSTFTVITVGDMNDTIRGIVLAKGDNNVYKQVCSDCFFNYLHYLLIHYESNWFCSMIMHDWTIITDAKLQVYVVICRFITKVAPGTRQQREQQQQQ